MTRPACACHYEQDEEPDDWQDDDTDTPEGCHGVRCDDCDDPNCASNPENGAGML